MKGCITTFQVKRTTEAGCYAAFIDNPYYQLTNLNDGWQGGKFVN
jgi:hypothetical protein